MTFLAVIHIVASIILIVIVLMQDSDGAMGGAFGGGGGSGSSSILGPTGTPSFLFKATVYLAIIFALTSFFLTKLSSDKGTSALDDIPSATKTIPAHETTPSPVAPTAPAAPAQPGH